MPLFMDRHDTPGATAEEVAQAHAADLAVSAKHGVQFLSYWFDGEDGNVFCFAKASGPEDLSAVHQESHGMLPNEIISVSEDDVFRLEEIAEVVAFIASKRASYMTGSLVNIDAGYGAR